jgi:hypothetical protein
VPRKALAVRFANGITTTGFSLITDHPALPRHHPRFTSTSSIWSFICVHPVHLRLKFSIPVSLFAFQISRPFA